MFDEPRLATAMPEARDDSDTFIASLVPLLRMLEEAIVVFRVNGRCGYANPCFERLVGERSFQRSGLVGAPAWVRAGHSKMWTFFFDLFRSGRAADIGIHEINIDLVSDSGVVLPVVLTWGRILGTDHRALALIGLVRPEPAANESGLNRDGTYAAKIGPAAVGMEHGAGRPRLPRPAPDTMLTHDERTDPWQRRLLVLSEREHEILDCVLEGNRVATMAQRLYLSEHTVRNHLKNINHKLGLHSLAELRERLTPVAALATESANTATVLDVRMVRDHGLTPGATRVRSEVR
jgi:DNA-binding CsgD family transcriptional regulator